MKEDLALSVSRIRKKYPNKLPVMVKNDVGLPKLDKEKFLVPPDLLLSEFTYIVRQRVKLDSKKALLLMSNNELLNSCQTDFLLKLYKVLCIWLCHRGNSKSF